MILYQNIFLIIYNNYTPLILHAIDIVLIFNNSPESLGVAVGVVFIVAAVLVQPLMTSMVRALHEYRLIYMHQLSHYFLLVKNL